MSFLQLRFFNFSCSLCSFFFYFLACCFTILFFISGFRICFFPLNFIVITKVKHLQILLLLSMVSYFGKILCLHILRYLEKKNNYSLNRVYSGLVIAHKWLYGFSLPKLHQKSPSSYLEIFD